MVSIIKNQLLKHLSKFTKNLSADKINLSTFKGEGELTNLELDEIVLTNLLELPSWLRITSAWCNKVTFRIQWTKLKNVPIFLSLDEVQIEVETCEDLREVLTPQNMAANTIPTKYSFIHKVIDGITVAVNTVVITFKSPAFIAKVQMSRIMVESRSPTWQKSDLRTTRIKDPDKGQLLIFKELEWQTLRIEAQSTVDKDLTPLRLLTNQARCRITIKKRLSDCLIMGSRLVIILDDLLWVLTDSQLKAALHFIDSLAGLIEKATILERKTKAARKIEVLPEYQAQISQQTRTKNQYNSAIAKIFARYDVIETSYHFLSQRIDLHLCDDSGPGRSLYPDLKDGGALQISLVKFQIDYYPYHLALGDRKHWALYKESATPHSQWLQQSLNSFRGQFMDLIDSTRTQNPPSNRNENTNENKNNTLNAEKIASNGNSNSQSTEQKKTPPQNSGDPVKNYVLEQLAKLMTTCIVIRIDDFTFYKVTTSTKKTMPKEFLSGDRDRFCLPDDVNIVHAEFTYYYYPGDIKFPLPPPKFFVQVNPIQIYFDVCSCLWFNSFLLNLYYSLLNTNNKKIENSSNLMYFDVKIEAILPRLIFESLQDYPNQRDRPKSLHLQTSRATITNVRSSEWSSRGDLSQCLNAFQMGQMFFNTDFPNQPGDFEVVADKFLKHCTGNDSIKSLPTNFSSNSLNEMLRQINRELLWTEAKDVWCCSFEPVWGDFLGARAVGTTRPVPFLDAFPLTLWLHLKSTAETASETTADIQGLAYISNLISIQINHYQYLFLLRISEMISELTTYLGIDSNKVLKVDRGGSLVIGALIPQVEVTFIMPSQTPGKENSGGDLESVIPDSSSIADDLGGSTTLWQNAIIARSDYVNKRMNTSNDIETPQSEISSMLSMDFGHNQSVSQMSVTFKQNEGVREESASLASSKTDKTLRNTIEEKPSKLTKSDSISSNSFMPNNFNVNLSSMKKGFSSFMTSLDSALKPSPEDGSSDTISMQSDVSSDSENYIVVSLEDQDKIDAAFSVNNSMRVAVVEEASEVIEETPDTQSEKSMDSVCKRKDLVSMMTFKLSKVEIVQQTSGFSSAIKVQVCNIASDECSSIPWDEFQTKFSSRSRGWVELPTDSDCRSRLKLRFDHFLKEEESNIKELSKASEDAMNSNLLSTNNRKSIGTQLNAHKINFHHKQSIMDLFQDNLSIRIMDTPLTLSMSSITGLTDLIEDEIIPKPIPLKIILENIKLHLVEDRPPNNITSPGAVPIDLAIAVLKLSRDNSGVFQIDAGGFSKTTGTEDTLDQLQSDNDELRRRITALERLSEENFKLQRMKEEMRCSLNTAQAEISSLLKDKQILNEHIKDLQHQLHSGEFRTSNRGSLWSNKR